MNVRELRNKYLEFFESKGHTRFPSGSLVPYDVTGRLDESLLFNGAGMVQFKPYFRGVAQPENKRLTTVQKCVRTGDIEEVGNLSHLTFFEMLGNFSFGDYFKSQAIDYSWEFLTSPQWLNLDPRKLSFTVFEEDDEAYACWADKVSSVGIEPSTRIFRLGEETNYWPAGSFSAGPPGPCGPNSEMFYWTTGDPPGSQKSDYTRDQWLEDDRVKNWLEIWNDVFIQFEWQGELKNPARPADGYRKTGMPDLPFKSIDTGMGLDRTACVLGGFKSVYDTDAFQPIVHAIAAKAGCKYGLDEAKDRAIRVIADHMRTASFCIADGILPGNNGRGYVLRRLIRRSLLKGQRTLGIEGAFLAGIFPAVADTMQDAYPELSERAPVITETLGNEEALFMRTLHSGAAHLAAELASVKDRILNGAAAFKLYDTFGFPLEVTKELCEEQGISVDEDGYEKALLEAQERSRAAGGMESVYGGVSGDQDWGNVPTAFTGYSATEGESVVTKAFRLGDDKVAVSLKSTPFYAQSGGQVADTGEMTLLGRTYQVTEVTKVNGVFVHVLQAPAVDESAWVGQPAFCKVDATRRAQTKRNHTATHLLHAALRSILGPHVAQAGSYVGPDRLRFDFTHGKAMSAQEIAQVERMVNQAALANEPVTTYVDIPIDEARQRGAMALFGEKYGDKVRMVEIGDFSRELCGGIHVKTAAEVGTVRIVSESSAASGIRRIEAVTGEAAYNLMLEQAGQLKEIGELLKVGPAKALEGAKRASETIKELNSKLEKARSQSASQASQRELVHNGFQVVVVSMEGDAKDATLAADQLAADKPNLMVVVAATGEGKVAFVSKAGSEALSKGAHAGNIVKALAQRTGGGGGGRAEFATAGGKDVAKVPEALGSIAEILAGV